MSDIVGITNGVMDFGEFVRSQGLPDDLIKPLCDELLRREQAEQHVEIARAAGAGGNHIKEKLPLMDGPDEFGRVEARIPIRSFLHWHNRKDVGPECWSDDTFINEYLRDNPQSRVKTIQPNGRIVVGYQAPTRKTVKRYA